MLSRNVSYDGLRRMGIMVLIHYLNGLWQRPLVLPTKAVARGRVRCLGIQLSILGKINRKSERRISKPPAHSMLWRTTTNWSETVCGLLILHPACDRNRLPAPTH